MLPAARRQDQGGFLAANAGRPNDSEAEGLDSVGASDVMLLMCSNTEWLQPSTQLSDTSDQIKLNVWNVSEDGAS
jgi:hypothetical protein